MPAPYGLELTENCATCQWKSRGFFCDLSPGALKSFEAIKYTSSYPAGALLFVEGQMPRGVYLLCKGRVKLAMSSADGKSIIIRIAGPGELMGLSGAMSGAPYEVSAETLEPCQVNFVKRDAFLRLLRDHQDTCRNIAEQFTSDYRAACLQIRALGLSRTAQEKIIRFLLEWSTKGRETNQGIKINVSLTHEEIAQVVGVSRETVTRTFSELKNKLLITIKGSTVIIRNKADLEAMVTAA